MRATLVFVALVATISCAPPKNEPLDLIARLESASPADRDRRVREAIERNGGTPFVEGDSALFLVEIPEGRSWSAWKSHIDDALLYLFPPERRSG